MIAKPIKAAFNDLLVWGLCLSLITITQTAYAQIQRSNHPSRATSRVKIQSLIDTATLRLVDGRKIRLIGISPLPRPKRKELPRNAHHIILDIDDPLVSLDQVFYETLEGMLLGQEIVLEFDHQYRDAQGNILGYMFLLDGTFVNAEILRLGFSNLSITPPNTRYAQQLRDAYLDAKKEKRGLQGN